MADTDMLKGMTDRSAPRYDESMKLPAKNIDDNPTRDSVGAQPKPPGPRVA